MGRGAPAHRRAAVSIELLVRPEAERDLADAHAWYESQRQGLGSEFLRSVEATLAAITRSPEMYPCIHEQVRRALVRRFPYGIFYVVDHDPARVVVLAVMHARRSPQTWQQRERDDPGPDDPG